uniref:Uncharacterized protein n=1 Tax=Ditylenchus dipsaci TaxID=166011 RepID=A0A915CKV4_9BILA
MRSVEACHLRGIQVRPADVQQYGSSSEQSVFQHTRGNSSKPNVFWEPEGPNIKGPEAKNESLEFELARKNQLCRKSSLFSQPVDRKRRDFSDICILSIDYIPIFDLISEL